MTAQKYEIEHKRPTGSTKYAYVYAETKESAVERVKWLDPKTEIINVCERGTINNYPNNKQLPYVQKDVFMRDLHWGKARR